MSAITSFFASFVSGSSDSTIHNDSDKAVDEVDAVEAEEEEEEEPEDAQPEIREECKTEKCAQLAKHFEHCQEKVQAGEGFKGEDCVEELMMHCIDDCAAPKLFAKLR